MDMLDDLISAERIYPQLAMKILANFDQAITEALQKQVKARLTFKVSRNCVIRRRRRRRLVLFHVPVRLERRVLLRDESMP